MTRSGKRSLGPAAALLAWGVFLSAAGCAGPSHVAQDSATASRPGHTAHPRASSEATAPAPELSAEFPGTRYDAVFSAAAKMLRDEGFAINRQDRRFGVITSKPTPSPTVLEPWVSDNHTAELAMASTAGMLRRIVRIDFIRDAESADEGSSFRVSIGVQLERFQAPTRRVLNGARGRVFTTLSATPSPWARRGIGARYWEPIGPDPRLQTYLLAALRQRLD